MATYSASSDAWARLGRLLRMRRAALDPRYSKRSVFCEATGLNYKLVADIETAQRTNFDPETLARFEVAYRWETGSIEQVLQGGDPVPVRPQGTEAHAPPPSPHPDFVRGDPLFEYIWSYPGDDASPLELRTAIMAVRELRQARASAAGGGGGGGVMPLRQADTG